MSFYGNVFYEFKNLFQKFKFLNTGLIEDNVNIPTTNSTVNGTTATQNWDTLHIESGNRWIGLSSMDEGGNHKGVTIFHRPPGGTSTTYSSFIPGDQNGMQLSPEQGFSTLAFALDNAGHVSNVETVSYQLPAAVDIVNKGLTTYHGGGAFKACIKAEGEEESAEDVTLTPGQKLEILQLNVTDKGIVSGFTTRNYILPMSDTEKDYAEVIDRLGNVELTVNDMVDNIPKTYATIANVGVVEDLYNPNSEEENKFITLTSSIGNLEKSTAQLDSSAANTLSVAEQITKVASIANQAEATAVSYGLSIKYLESEIENLKNEVASLKAQLNQTE